jgi:hypothetical protein
MRSYFKCWRTPDFKVLRVDPLPPGIDVNSLELLYCLLADAHEWVPPLYNRIAAGNQWYATDGDSSTTSVVFGTLTDGDSGLTLANKLYDLRPYDGHPKN